jgi:hypothetical protein
MSTLPAVERSELESVQRWSLIVGGAALTICVIGAFFSPAQFFRAYLGAYLWCLGTALGCMVLLMLYHVTGGAWGFVLRRSYEAAMRTLPLMAALFVPIAAGVRYLYPWVDPAIVGSGGELKFNHTYLNVPFFYFRAVLYFAAWILISFILSTWSRRQDRVGEIGSPRKFRLLSAPSMAVYGLTITFASVDWTMSTQPEFHSTMWGPLFAAGQILSGQAFVVVVLGWLASRPPLRDVVSRDVLNDIGNLLFSFLVIWAYMAFFQFMLVWMANLREEAAWYLPRVAGGWRALAWSLFLLHFAVPFFALLMREVKRSPQALMRVAALILFMRLVGLYWEILPAYPDQGLAQHWMDFVAPVGVGGIWLSAFLWLLKQNPVLPQHDPSQLEALRLRERDEEEARREAMHHG